MAKTSFTSTSSGAPETRRQRLERWAQGQQLNASAATVNAKSLLALSLVKVLEALQRQIQEYRSRITQAL